MGAWEWIYKPGGEVDDPRYELGVVAYQKLLQYNGRYKKGTIDGIYGKRMAGAVKRFQRDADLVVDGVLGSGTAKALVIPLIVEFAITYHIPNDYLCGQTRHESLYDAVATGWLVEGDRGYGQINVQHTDVSDEEAYDPWFSLNWSGKRMSDAHKRYKDRCPKRAWTCAIAYHNRPKSAEEWCDGGLKNVKEVRDSQGNLVRTAKEEQERIRRYVESIKLGC